MGSGEIVFIFRIEGDTLVWSRMMSGFLGYVRGLWSGAGDNLPENPDEWVIGEPTGVTREDFPHFRYEKEEEPEAEREEIETGVDAGTEAVKELEISSPKYDADHVFRYITQWKNFHINENNAARLPAEPSSVLPLPPLPEPVRMKWKAIRTDWVQDPEPQ